VAAERAKLVDPPAAPRSVSRRHQEHLPASGALVGDPARRMAAAASHPPSDRTTGRRWPRTSNLGWHPESGAFDNNSTSPSRKLSPRLDGVCRIFFAGEGAFVESSRAAPARAPQHNLAMPGRNRRMLDLEIIRLTRQKRLTPA